MKLGISTACFYPLPIEQALDEIGKLGLRTAEIFFNTESEYFEPLISKIERHVKENGMESLPRIHSRSTRRSANEGILLFSEYTPPHRGALSTTSIGAVPLRSSILEKPGNRLGAKIFHLPRGAPQWGLTTDGGIIETARLRYNRRLIEAAAEMWADLPHGDVACAASSEPGIFAHQL